MRKILVTLAIAVTLYLGIGEGFTVGTTYAQCGCSCAMICGNRCQFACEGCNSVWDIIVTAAACCDGAHAATGDTEPCPVGGGES